MRKVHPRAPEVAAFKARAVHAHYTPPLIEYWGDGKRVLAIAHAGRRREKTVVELYEPGDVMWSGRDFKYGDFFNFPEDRL